MKGISKETANNIAKNLKGFGGHEEKPSKAYAGEEPVMYAGADDDLLDFGGSNCKSFADEGKAGLTFGLTIKNTYAADKKVALTPGYLDRAAKLATATGLSIDAVVGDGIFDGTEDEGIIGTPSNSSQTIENFKEFIKNHPTRVLDIVIKANDEAFFDNEMQISDMQPFRNSGSKNIPLTQYISPNQFEQTKAVIKIARDYPEFQFDDQKIIVMTIPGTDNVSGGGQVKLTYKIGAILNKAGALAQKAARASMY